MEQKIYMNYIHPSSLLRQLSDLWKADKLCDAVITVDNVVVAKAHKVVLHAVSSKLKYDSCSSQQSSVLDVSLPCGINHKSVDAFLQYIYEGYLILTRELAMDLLKISNFLKIKCLTNCCRDYLDSLHGVIALDESSVDIKTEEFTHVRTKAMKDSSKKRHKSDGSGDETATSKPKKHRKNHLPSGAVKTSASQPQQGQRPRSPSSASAESVCVIPHGDGDSVASSVPSSHNVTGDSNESWKERTVSASPSLHIKVEPVEHISGEVDSGSNWRSPGITTDIRNSNIMSQSFQKVPPNTNVKEEPHDVSFDDVSSAPGDLQGQYDGQMWFSPESGTVEALNQTAPVESMSSPVAGTSSDNMPQKAATPYSSLAQMRAQQSVKRSIQSSFSVARRWRNNKPGPGESAGASVPDGGGGPAEVGDEDLSMQAGDDGLAQGSQEVLLAAGSTKSPRESVRSLLKDATFRFNSNSSGPAAEKTKNSSPNLDSEDTVLSVGSTEECVMDSSNRDQMSDNEIVETQPDSDGEYGNSTVLYSRNEPLGMAFYKGILCTVHEEPSMMERVRHLENKTKNLDALHEKINQLKLTVNEQAIKIDRQQKQIQNHQKEIDKLKNRNVKHSDGNSVNEMGGNLSLRVAKNYPSCSRYAVTDPAFWKIYLTDLPSALTKESILMAIKEASHKPMIFAVEGYVISAETIAEALKDCKMCRNDLTKALFSKIFTLGEMYNKNVNGKVYGPMYTPKGQLNPYKIGAIRTSVFDIFPPEKGTNESGLWKEQVKTIDTYSRYIFSKIALVLDISSVLPVT